MGMRFYSVSRLPGIPHFVFLHQKPSEKTSESRHNTWQPIASLSVIISTLFVFSVHFLALSFL